MQEGGEEEKRGRVRGDDEQKSNRWECDGDNREREGRGKG